MTILEFCEKLKFAGSEWYVLSNGPIRGVLTDRRLACCPITAVAHSAMLGDAIRVGESLGLSKDDSRTIVEAADNYASWGNDGPRHVNQDVRQQLLAAVGLGGRS